MKTAYNNYSSIILAGGHSSRMGTPKPWLTKGNTTFLAAIIQSYLQIGISDIVVVLNDNFTSSQWKNELTKASKNAIIIKNYSPEKGRLFSLQLGLNEIKSDKAFIHNVDNPFVEIETLKLLLQHSQKEDITIPSYDKKNGHPVVISKKVKEEILNNYLHYSTLKDIFSKFKKKYVEVDSNSIHININTPKDLATLFNESIH